MFYLEFFNFYFTNFFIFLVCQQICDDFLDVTGKRVVNKIDIPSFMEFVT